MILNLLDRMKLPFRKNKEFHSVLYDILGFYPHNIELYRTAFAHKSLAYRTERTSGNESKDRRRKDRNPRRNYKERPQKPINNERLEFLGDAVLETVVSDILFRHFAGKREGFLTATRSKIVQRDMLNHLSADMGLEKLIQAAEGTRMTHTNIGGNAFEALMGAIYLDRGYKYCHWFMANRIFGRYIDLEKIAQKEVNFKSKLLEWSQKNRINIHFDDRAENGAQKGFVTIITIEGITLSRGEGRAKKDSQQEASKEALRRMRSEPNTYDNIFRAKEKRTAMEAEESFALPRLEEDDTFSFDNLSNNRQGKQDKAPVLESNKKDKRQTASDAAYDTAYDENAEYEVIDTAPEQPLRTNADYDELGIPAPPIEDEIKASEEKLRKKRQRGRGAKTVGDAVKAIEKGTSTPEEKASRREAENKADKERAKERAERKAQAEARRKEKAERAKAAAEQTVTETATTLDEATEQAEQPAGVLAETNDIAQESDTTFVVQPSVSEGSDVVVKEAVENGLEQTAAPEFSETASKVEEAASKVEETAQELSEATSVEEPAASVSSETTNAEVSEDIEEKNNEQTDDLFSTEKIETSASDEKANQEAETTFFVKQELTPVSFPQPFEEETTNEAEEEAKGEQQSATDIDPLPGWDDEDDDATGETSAKPHHAPASNDQIMPRLRHLTTDDLIFGMEDTADDMLAEEVENVLPQERKKKNNRRRRKPQKPKGNEVEANNREPKADRKEAKANKDEAKADKKEKAEKPKHHRPHRRRPTKTEE